MGYLATIQMEHCVGLARVFVALRQHGGVALHFHFRSTLESDPASPTPRLLITLTHFSEPQALCLYLRQFPLRPSILSTQLVINMAQSQAQLQGLTAQLQALAAQMSSLVVQTPPASPAAPSQPALTTIEDRVSSLEAQLAELTANFGDMRDSLNDNGLSVSTLMGDLNIRTAA
jgi:uncharacterized coiled-coil protein SlyX